MATPTFNITNHRGSIAGLQFSNSGMAGLLSATGNAVRVLVDSPGVKESRFEAAAGDWTSVRFHGLGVRRVIWDCQLKCDSEANLNSIEATIEAYLADGGMFTLNDGKSRTSTYARMLRPPETRRVGPRERATYGPYFQKWRIGFEILKPVVGDGTKL